MALRFPVELLLQPVRIFTEFFLRDNYKSSFLVPGNSWGFFIFACLNYQVSTDFIEGPPSGGFLFGIRFLIKGYFL